MCLKSLISRGFIVFCFCFLAACANTAYSPSLNNTLYQSRAFDSFSRREKTESIWKIMARNFNLPSETASNSAVHAQINWYLARPAYLRRVASHAEPYLYYIYQQVRIHHLPAELALLPMFESAYDPYARSHVGAVGLWQMMPGTASGFGLKVNWWYDGRRDIIASTNSALDYLAYLGRFFHHDWLLALAAYDTGEGKVNATMEYNLKRGRYTDFWHLPLPQETQNYVPKLLALATILKHPDRYSFHWPYIPDRPYLTIVNVGFQIDLVHAAKMAGVSLKDLLILNPGYNRRMTDPNGPHKLVLPIEKAGQFEAALNQLPQNKKATWIRYNVEAGDSLSGIAHKFKTTTVLVKRINHLKSSHLKIGQLLLISTDTRHLANAILHTQQKYFAPVSHRVPEEKITNYRVKKGDTIEKIAKKFHVTSRDIRFWNNRDKNNPLKIGTLLVLWPKHQHYLQHNQILHYRIGRGDSLGKIAGHYHTSETELKRLNHLKTNTIKLGALIKVPVHSSAQHHTSLHKMKSVRHSSKKTVKKSTKKIVHHAGRRSNRTTYYVKAHDTLAGIAHKYHTTVDDLRRWNQISHPDQLKPHQVLVIYYTHTHRV